MDYSNHIPANELIKAIKGESFEQLKGLERIAAQEMLDRNLLGDYLEALQINYDDRELVIVSDAIIDSEDLIQVISEEGDMTDVSIVFLRCQFKGIRLEKYSIHYLYLINCDVPRCPIVIRQTSLSGLVQNPVALTT